MPYPTSVFQRPPQMTNALSRRYAQISKADWADLYFDLFRQIHGETVSDAAIMQDAEKRLGILKSHRLRCLRQTNGGDTLARTQKGSCPCQHFSQTTRGLTSGPGKS